MTHELRTIKGINLSICPEVDSTYSQGNFNQMNSLEELKNRILISPRFLFARTALVQF